MSELIPFADRIREYMKEYDLTQLQVAERTGYSQQAVAPWLAGKAIPKFGDIEEVADKMGVSVAWLMGIKNTTMKGENDNINELLAQKAIDQDTMDNAPRADVNGSMYPVYTKEQTDKRLAMLQQAFDMYNGGKIDKEIRSPSSPPTENR